MKRFLAATLGTLIVVACGGSSSSDISDTSGGSDAGNGSADGSTTNNGDGSTTGNGDSGGGSDSGGGGGNDGGGGGTDASTPCTIDGTGASVGCGANEFCYSSDCTNGICLTKPSHTSNNKYDPQCGCDGVTYWNKEYAAVGGESISAGGVCTSMTTPKALMCQTGMCPKGASYGCAAEMTACSVLPPQLPEACWFLPEANQCPDSPKVQSCGSVVSADAGVTCVGLCTAIDSKTVFARNASCN
jgi:hypothetical protein